MECMFICSVILLAASVFSHGSANLIEDKQALLDFLHNMSHSNTLNWGDNSPICITWTGVTCNYDQSRVIALRLPRLGLQGPIPPNTLSRLSSIQILSLKLNNISGSFPADFSKLTTLTALYLQYNKILGPLPSNFSAWRNLEVLNLSNNALNGSIPISVSSLSHLLVMDLSNNLLSGEVPNLDLPNLKQINLSNNKLIGVLPLFLNRFSTSSYSGNNISLSPNFAGPLRKTRKIGESALLGFILGGCAFIFALLALLMVIYSSKKGVNHGLEHYKGDTSSEKTVSRGENTNTNLVFFEGSIFAFDLEDLLRASAEVLGKGTLGMTYKATLEDSTTVVVKRMKEVNATRREFELQMEIAGHLRHENIVPLRAYYYSKDEKLVMYEYYREGSIFSLLHGLKGQERNSFDWEARVRVAIGAARGLAHIHAQNGGRLVHGNIKSSNIFFNSVREGCVSDFCLSTVMSSTALTLMRLSGYKAPEVTEFRKMSQVSDVYSFGVLILELLTGKSPVYLAGREDAMHLVRWVQSVVREEWTAEVFDVELLRHPGIEEEMVEMLQIGMVCVSRMPEHRPKMVDVVKMLEDICRVGGGARISSEVRLGGSNVASPQLPV